VDADPIKPVTRSLTRAPHFLFPLLAALALAVAGTRAGAQTATNITGLYYTGLAANGNLQVSGGQDANWTVAYASTNGGASENATYEGAAYVISPSSIAGSGYTPNTANAQWITAPGATDSAGNNPNTGGDYLPGNGNSAGSEGIYIYTLAFTITGTGAAGTVVNSANSKIQITMTLAADDQYSVFVNPTGSNPTASATKTSAWNNTSQISLQNYGGAANNATFKIGVNYIVIEVDNTNSINGTSNSTQLNASGLLVYQTSAATINGAPVPEVATFLPLLGVIGCYGLVAFRRRQASLQPVRA
jgi:hypothetical protein